MPVEGILRPVLAPIARPAAPKVVLALLFGALVSVFGCGGTLKDGSFEFQGDHREKLEKFLLADGYKIKRVGG